MDVNETKKNQTASGLVEILSQMAEKATTAAEVEALTAAVQIVAAQGAERNVGRTRFVPETAQGPCTGGQGKEHYSSVSR